MTLHPTPGVYHDGTRAYLDGRRLAVWVLHGFRLAGESDAAIIAAYDLTAEDLAAAWRYVARNPDDVRLALAENGDRRRGKRRPGCRGRSGGRGGAGDSSCATLENRCRLFD